VGSNHISGTADGLVSGAVNLVRRWVS